MKKFYSILFLAFTLSFVYAATITKTVNVITPGTLTSLLTSDEKLSILNLTVNGNINAWDFKCIRDEVRNITVLDMRGSNIIESGGEATDDIEHTQNHPANEIPSGAFKPIYDGQYNYILKTVYLPNSATSIATNAFLECSQLTDIIIGNSLTTIKTRGIRTCKLSSITLPESVAKIEFGVFMDCGLANGINVHPNNQFFSSIDGVLFNKNQTTLIKFAGIRQTYTIPNTVKTIEALAFYYRTNLTTVTIPNSVDSICVGAFESCSKLSSIIIPNSVRSIGAQAFCYTGLTSVYIGNSLEKIEFNTFGDCINLKTVKLGNSIKIIDSYAFRNCKSLKNINIPNSVIRIGAIPDPNPNYHLVDAVFGDCNLSSFVIPSSVNSMSENTTGGCWNLMTAYSYKTAPFDRFPFAFLRGNYTLFVPEGTSEKYRSANGWKDFTNIIEMTTKKTVNVTTAGTLNSLFNSTEKKTINNLTVSGNIDARDIKFMRDEIPMLEILDISATTIQAYNGSGGTNNKILSYSANELPSNSFEDINDTTIIYYLDLTNIKLPTTITSIGKKAFGNCGGLKSISIPASVASIGDSVFYECNHLNRVICMSNTPYVVGNDAFLGTPISTIFVPKGTLDIYKAASGWKSFPNILEYKLKVSTNPVTSIKLKSATVNGNIDLIASSNLKNYGFCWNSTGLPTIDNNKLEKGVTEIEGLFTDSIFNLKQKSTYFVRAFATDDDGTSYGNEVSFVTQTVPDTAKIITGNINVCINQKNVIYTVAPVINATKYTWTLPNGDVETSDTNNITVNYYETSTSGNLSVFGSNVWGDGAPATIYINVNSTPSNAGVISGNINVYNGENSILYSVPEIDNATTYLWILPSGATGSSITNSISVNFGNLAVSGNITVKGQNACSEGLASSLAINVNRLTVNAGDHKSTFCGDSIVYLNATTNFARNEKLRFRWTPATGLNNDSIVNPTATVTSDITYTVTVTTPNGCTATDEVKVTVTPLTANAGADKTIICGGTTQLNSVTTNYTGTGTLKYKWTPSTGLNNDAIVNPTSTVTNDITYTVTVTTPNGCTATDEVSVTIIPMAKPEIGMVGVSSNNKNLIVWNKPVSAGIESYYIYRETNVTNVYEKIGFVPYDSLSIFVDNQSLPDVKSNKYKLSILDRHALESPQSNYHKTMHLAINKGMGNAWNLSWEAYEGFVVSTYNIYRGTTPINLTLLGSTSGSNTQYNDLNAPSGDVYYQLEVISPNNVNPAKVHSLQKTKAEENGMSNSLISYSSSRSNIATNVVSGINELGENNKINIYPNPVKNELRINFEGGSTFEILNLMGQVVYNGNLINNTIVQTSNLSSGIYLIRFKTGKSFEYKKIIKE